MPSCLVNLIYFGNGVPGKAYQYFCLFKLLFALPPIS